jgi:hypothetical protein
MKNLKTIRKDTGWININNFKVGYEPFIDQNYAVPAYRVIDKVCFLRGVILKSNSILAQTALALIFDLEIKPTTRCNFLIPGWTTSDIVISTISTILSSEGDLNIFATPHSTKRFFSLDGINYPI